MNNQNVKLKHKVQLKRKSGEPIVEDPKTPQEPMRHSNKNKWLWVVAAIILVGIIIICVKGCNSNKPTISDTSDGDSIPSIVDTIGITNEPIEQNDTVSTAVESDNLPNEGDAVSPSDVNAGQQASVSNVSDDLEAEAIKVIRGEYGIGQERKDKLGSKYQPIQNRVNELKREGVF
jgi:hypothetical protein